MLKMMNLLKKEKKIEMLNIKLLWWFLLWVRNKKENCIWYMIYDICWILFEDGLFCLLLDFNIWDVSWMVNGKFLGIIGFKVIFVKLFKINE